jgi:hypothetical protein
MRHTGSLCRIAARNLSRVRLLPKRSPQQQRCLANQPVRVPETPRGRQPQDKHSGGVLVTKCGIVPHETSEFDLTYLAWNFNATNGR